MAEYVRETSNDIVTEALESLDLNSSSSLITVESSTKLQESPPEFNTNIVVEVLEIGLETVLDKLKEQVESQTNIDMAKHVITEFATQELLQLIGIGAGCATLNMTGFALAQINKKLDEIKKQINTILGAPAIEAFDHLQRGIQSVDGKNYRVANEDFNKVVDKGIEGRIYEKENLETVASLSKYIMFSDVMINTYDTEKALFIPYELLDVNKKRSIKNKIMDHLKKLLTTQKSQKLSFFKLPSSKRKKKEDNQKLVNEVLQYSLQFICPPDSPVPIMYIPYGMEDAALLNLLGKPGHFDDKSVHIWRDDEKVIIRSSATGKIAQVDVKEREEFLLQLSPSGLCVDDVPLTMEFNHRSADLIQLSDNGEVSQIKSLLMEGCDVNVLVEDVGNHERKVSDILNPLILACYRGHNDVVTILLEQPNVDVNKKDENSNTALHKAAEFGHLDIVKSLVEAKADVGALDDAGNSPAQLAKKGDHEAVFDYLSNLSYQK